MSSSPDEQYPHLWTVILAGGVGSRFWPASTPSQPKQLLKLASERPLIRDTVDRIVPLIPTERLRILTGNAPRRARSSARFRSSAPATCCWSRAPPAPRRCWRGRPRRSSAATPTR